MNQKDNLLHLTHELDIFYDGKVSCFLSGLRGKCFVKLELLSIAFVMIIISFWLKTSGFIQKLLPVCVNYIKWLRKQRRPIGS